MNKQLNQSGFSVLSTLLIIVILALVGFVGWRVYDMNKAEPAESTSTQQNNASDDVPPINSVEDLDNAASALNDQDIDAQLDTSEIDAALNE